MPSDTTAAPHDAPSPQDLTDDLVKLLSPVREGEDRFTGPAQRQQPAPQK